MRACQSPETAIVRDIGIFISNRVSLEELVEFVRSYASGVDQPIERRSNESVLGEPPDVLYISDETAPTNGDFSDKDKAAIEARLGATVESYISIHFTSTDDAFTLADGLAHQIGRLWRGILDYSGTGGGLASPPNQIGGSTPESSRD